MINKLKALLGENLGVLENENLKEHTTFRVGGPAKALVTVKNVTELKQVLALLKESKENYFILGNGSNLLVSDAGYDGYVIRLLGDFSNIEVKKEENKITAGAGVMLSKVCVLARDNSMTGLEFAYGIPGTVGGAMVMNAGAYDGEMSFVTETVTLLDENLEEITLTKDEMCFGYRDSVLKHKEMIALYTTFSVQTGETTAIQAKMSDFMERRKSKQPLEFPSAGSTFKRPEGYFAGKLIQDAGLAGYRVGGASVSEKHCGFVVNDKQGTAKDINDLMNQVSDKVFETSGVKLEAEVIKIGDFI